MHRHAVVLEDVADLLLVIALEQIGAGERGAVDAWLEQHAVGQPRIDMEVGAADGHSDVRIEGVDGPRRDSAGGLDECCPDAGDAVGVDPLDPGHGGGRVIEGCEIAGMSRRKTCAAFGTEAVHPAPRAPPW
jgi:hypothetical protein